MIVASASHERGLVGQHPNNCFRNFIGGAKTAHWHLGHELIETQRHRIGHLRFYVPVNSGQVVVRSIGSDLRMDYTAVGQTTHLAARLEQHAPANSIWLTAGTLHLAS